MSEKLTVKLDIKELVFTVNKSTISQAHSMQRLQIRCSLPLARATHPTIGQSNKGQQPAYF
jgi:hypothetical protein